MLRLVAGALVAPFGLDVAGAFAAAAKSTAGWKPVTMSFAGYYGNLGGTGSAAPMRIAQADYTFQIDGDRYQFALKVNSALANLLYESAGLIDANGLHPKLYRESRRLPLRQPSVRELRLDEAAAPGAPAPRNASTPPVPGSTAAADAAAPGLAVPYGTQDRISVIAQISWLARTQPKRFNTGAELKLPLASWDSVDDVAVVISAPQSLPIENGVSVKARQIRRQNAEGNNGTLDFWLVEDEQKLPAVISFADGGKGLRFVRIPG